MKNLATFSALLIAAFLAAPSASWARDRHRHDCDDRGYHRYSYSRDYCPPVVSYRRYQPYVGHSSYPSYYGYSSVYPVHSYYSRPALSLSFSTSPSYYRSTTRAADSDDLAVDVQRALARRGYYRGAIDGDVGPGTRGAIREYQYRNRLEVTGRIDRSLLRSLGVS